MKISTCFIQSPTRLDLSDARITYPPEPPEALKRSVREMGILTPILCLENAGRLKILDGNRRYLITRALKMDMVPVAVLTDASPRELARTWIQAQQVVRSLNVFEVAGLLERSESWLGLSREEMRRIIVSDSSLSLSPAILENLPDLLTLPDQIKRAAVSRAYSPAFLLRMVHLYSRELIETVDRLLGDFSFSENHLDLLLEWMDDICRRDGMGPSDLLRTEPVAFVLSHPRMSSAKKRDALLRAIRRFRFPRQARLEATLRGMQQKVASLGDVRLIAPKDLMGDRYELRIGFRESGELQTLLDRVSRLMAILGKEIERL